MNRPDALRTRIAERQTAFFRAANKAFNAWKLEQQANIWNHQTFDSFQKTIRNLYDELLQSHGCNRQELRQLKIAASRRTLAKYVGEPNGVQVATRQLARDRLAWTNDLYGTLLEIHRTRCVVHFGEEHGEWRFPVDMIIPWNMSQAWMLGASMERPADLTRQP